MLRLYGHPLSVCTQRVLVTLNEKGVPYELIPVNVSKREEKENIAKQNPFAQIPVMADEDGFELYESRAIARYIAIKYASQGTPLYPDTSDIKTVALFERAASIEAFNYTSFAAPAVFQLVMAKFAGVPSDEGRGLAALEMLRAKLKAYDVILSKQRFLAGDTLTLVDLFHLPDGELITNVVKSDVLTSDATPNVARWWREIASLPSWRAVMAEAAEARKEFGA